jgi:hypothetical protein
MLLAGLAGFACSQEAQEPVEIGTTQVELRSDLVLSEAQRPTTALLDEKNPDYLGQFSDPIQATQRIPLTTSVNYSQDRTYHSVKRYEFLPALLTNPKTRKNIAQKDNVQMDSGTLADKHWVRAGKGFGVASERMASSKTVRLDHASYYFPTIASKPYSKASEHLEPTVEPFKSQKPLVFHHGATGFAHEPPEDNMFSDDSPGFKTRLELSPIPETQVYLSSKPKTHVTLAPAKNRLDLMNGNKNLNRDRFNKLR